MLPYEQENREGIGKHYSSHLKGAGRLISFALDVVLSKLDQQTEEESVGRHTSKLITVMAIRRYRAIVLLCEYGHVDDAEVLERSLYEVSLAARFVMIPQIPKQEWSSELSKEFNKLTDLSGKDSLTKFTDMDFRALLYLISDVTSLSRHDDRLAKSSDPRIFEPDDSLRSRLNDKVNEARREIGDEWVDRLKRKNKYSGFSTITLLAEYCGRKAHHDAVYPRLSSKSHGQGAGTLVGGPSDRYLALSIRLSGAIIGEILEDLNEAFHLGLADEIKQSAVEFELSTPIED